MAGIAGGLAVLGTGVVVLARYITLPDRVEAGEQKNEAQDKQIDRLITLQEFYAKQQPPVPSSVHPSSPQLPNGDKPVIREYDGEDCWECVLESIEICWKRKAWRRCK